MNLKLLGDASRVLTPLDADRTALTLRVGLGLVFLAGGWWKLSRAIDPERADALVARYTADNGYINAFFDQYLFADPGALLSPLSFLIMLSAFELVTGVALIAGLFVRALSFIYAFLLWFFVIALPVVTAPGAEVAKASYFSPALLVQVRDIGLSGMFFVLLALGSGAYSLDRRLLKRGAPPQSTNWDAYGLLLRLSVAAVFLVGGFFAGYDHIKSFVDVPVILVAVGAILASGHLTRIASAAAFVIIAWYCVGKLSLDMSPWSNFNAIKREIAFLAASGVLFVYGGGTLYRLGDLLQRPASSLLGRPLST